MELNNKNYFSQEATSKYWSVSLFKEFNKCEALGSAVARGAFQRTETDALLIGSYVDASLTGNVNDFIDEYGDKMFKKNGELLAKFTHADEIIERVKRDNLMMDYLTGDNQTIMTANLFNVDWKIKMDVYNENRIVDLKCVKDFSDIYDKDYGWRSWIEYWGYDIQGAVYQKIEQLATGRTEPLPFYIAAVTKEKTPDIKLIQLPQHILDTALAMVEAKIERFDLIKSLDVEPIRCEHCDYCKETKVLTDPEVYEIKEAE